MRLLLVEDEKILADALAKILKKRGYETDVSYDGESGLDNALSGIYDVIVLDRMLPGMNGIEVVKNIRKEGVTTPVIFLTAIGGISEKVNGLDAGADDYLSKPFSSDELLARIRALLRRREKDFQTGNDILMGKLQYNSTSHELYCKDSEIKLSFKEEQLFELLLLNKGKTLSKDRIFEKIWGFNTDSDLSIVEIYIHHIRKKLPPDITGVEIKTVRGIGYRLIEL